MKAIWRDDWVLHDVDWIYMRKYYVLENTSRLERDVHIVFLWSYYNLLVNTTFVVGIFLTLTTPRTIVSSICFKF